MALFATAHLSKKVIKAVKKQLRLLKLKAKYEAVPASNPHQSELDENALNEALEARLMETIANTPAQTELVTLTLKVTMDSSSDNTIDTQICLPQIQTRFQQAQAQC